jgi:uracil-DNA glycosylase
MPKITIVGEAYGEAEEKEGRAFAGASGYILNKLLEQAGIDRHECRVRCVFNFRPPKGAVENLMVRDKREAAPGFTPFARGRWLPPELVPHITQLFQWIEHHKPNVVLALGHTALWALTRATGIMKWRGSALLTHDKQWKVLPTYAPAAVLRQWELRPIVYMDLQKLKKEAEDPRLIRPRRYIQLSPSLSDIEAFYHKHIVPAPFVACDIETAAGQITEVGFATSASRALVIPFRMRHKNNYWPTQKEEILAWSWVRRILAEKPTVGQNFQYDMQYFFRVYGIPCPNFIGDTMLLHHSLQPELQKGLGFLGSIYTREPSWKFMRQDHENLKREE